MHFVFRQVHKIKALNIAWRVLHCFMCLFVAVEVLLLGLLWCFLCIFFLVYCCLFLSCLEGGMPWRFNQAGLTWAHLLLNSAMLWNYVLLWRQSESSLIRQYTLVQQKTSNNKFEEKEICMGVLAEAFNRPLILSLALCQVNKSWAHQLREHSIAWATTACKPSGVFFFFDK